MNLDEHFKKSIDPGFINCIIILTVTSLVVVRSEIKPPQDWCRFIEPPLFSYRATRGFSKDNYGLMFIIIYSCGTLRSMHLKEISPDKWECNIPADECLPDRDVRVQCHTIFYNVIYHHFQILLVLLPSFSDIACKIKQVVSNSGEIVYKWLLFIRPAGTKQEVPYTNLSKSFTSDARYQCF